MFSGVPDVAWGSTDGNGGTAGPILTAVTAMDGTGTVTTVFTAGANGSYVQRLICRPVGTNVASVLRVFLNNGSTNATQANNVIIAEATLPASTANAAAALAPVELPLNYAIPARYQLNVALGTTIAAGVRVCVLAGDY